MPLIASNIMEYFTIEGDLISHLMVTTYLIKILKNFMDEYTRIEFTEKDSLLKQPDQ